MVAATAGKGTACHAIGRVLIVFATSDWPDTRRQGGILLPLYYDYVSQRGARPLVAVSLFRPVRATRDGRPRITRPHSRAARGKSHFAYPLVSVDRWIFPWLEETPQPPTYITPAFEPGKMDCTPQWSTCCLAEVVVVVKEQFSKKFIQKVYALRARFTLSLSLSLSMFTR